MANVPIQSLIDHIKTAIDVDPWAKEMAEELLKKQEPKLAKNINGSEVGIRLGFCPECQKLIYYNILNPAEFCKYCGQAVRWDDTIIHTAKNGFTEAR